MQNPVSVSMPSCSDNSNSPLPNEEEEERVWTDEQADSSGEQGQGEETAAKDERKVHDNLQQVILLTLAHVVSVLTVELWT